MKEIKINFHTDGMVLTCQLISLLHVAIACFATVAVLRKRKELNLGILPTLIIAWLVPIVGPASILWGLRESPAK
jgi:hypothetical protein